MNGIKPVNKAHAQWIEQANAEGLIDWHLVGAIQQDLREGVYRPDDAKWDGYEYDTFLNANCVLGLA